MRERIGRIQHSGGPGLRTGTQVFLVGASRRAAWFNLRIFAQAMDLASFEDVLRLEAALGAHHLIEVMLRAEPGWISERSWDFWRGRLTLATGAVIPEAPPRRSFDGRLV